MLLGVFGLNSCLALGIATALGVALPYTAAISCTEFKKMCDIDNQKPKTPEQIKKDEKKEIEKKQKYDEYIQSIILEKRKNTEVFENISILLPERLEFRKKKKIEEREIGDVVSELYDKQKRKFFSRPLFIIKRRNKDFNKIIKNGKDENYEANYKEEKQKVIDKEIKKYERLLVYNKDSEKNQNEFMKTIESNLKEYNQKKEKGFKIETEVIPIGKESYMIVEKINDFGSEWTDVTYVKILKDGVYIIGYENSKDIFVGLFGE